MITESEGATRETRQTRGNASAWLSAVLRRSGLQWRRNARINHRRYAWWCRRLGVAIEWATPGSAECDSGRWDRTAYERDGIIVMHVRPWSESDAEAIRGLRHAGTWDARRSALGLQPLSEVGK